MKKGSSNLISEQMLLLVCVSIVCLLLGYGIIKKEHTTYEITLKSYAYQDEVTVSQEKENTKDKIAPIAKSLCSGVKLISKFTINQYDLNQVEKKSNTIELENLSIEEKSYECITNFGYKVSTEELVLLAKLVNRESCYEPYDGQVAVAATVINRLKSDLFEGDTITEILYSPGQYDNGIPLSSYSYNEQNMQAAKDAIAGYDPTKGAVFYYNPELSNDTWIPSHILSCVIGHHSFFYVYKKT